MGITERREREKEQRRNTIIDAAEQIFFSKGVVAATMDDVAEKAELSKGTLYLYFRSKEDLYLAITQRGLAIMTDMFKKAITNQKRGIDRVRAIGRAYMQFSKKHYHYFQSMIYFESHFKDFEIDSLYALACEEQGEEALGILIEALQKGIKDGSIRVSVRV